MARVVVGLGSNLGDRVEEVRRGFEALEGIGRVVRRSSLYRTAPWGKTDQPEFVNAIAIVETPASPREVLASLKAIERRRGRVAGERWGPRTLDLDLLAYDDAVIDEPGLSVPHPGLKERAFVLVPLAEVDPSYAADRDALPESELAGVVGLGSPFS
ncbi:MAG TPA: 2-amino-4-hydroxy-6-hydroxymethyldihydropteridine diphosphokinase [Candidatus Acidoferrales bacterium]|nr:2-amino-4-hydroxy-6-hydroxymethyldihydropteridine diphosphokinase [Candidatus Acidoferrales bacterium]